MDHASLEELAKSSLRLRFDTAGAQRGKRKEKVGRGVSTRQTSSQNLGNVTAIESGKGPKLYPSGEVHYNRGYLLSQLE